MQCHTLICASSLDNTQSIRLFDVTNYTKASVLPAGNLATVPRRMCPHESHDLEFRSNITHHLSASNYADVIYAKHKKHWNK